MEIMAVIKYSPLYKHSDNGIKWLYIFLILAIIWGLQEYTILFKRLNLNAPLKDPLISFS